MEVEVDSSEAPPAAAAQVRGGERAEQKAVSPFRSLLRTSARYRAIVIRASIFTVLNTLCDVAPEILIGLAVNVLVSHQDSFLTGLGVTAPFDQILALAGMTLVIWVAESLTQYR